MATQRTIAPYQSSTVVVCVLLIALAALYAVLAIFAPAQLGGITLTMLITQYVLPAVGGVGGLVVLIRRFTAPTRPIRGHGKDPDEEQQG